MPRLENEEFISQNGFEVKGMSGPNDDGDILHARFKPTEKGYVSLQRGYLLVTHDATKTTVYIPLSNNIIEILSKRTPGQREILEVQGEFGEKSLLPHEVKGIISRMLGDEEF